MMNKKRIIIALQLLLYSPHITCMESMEDQDVTVEHDTGNGIEVQLQRQRTIRSKAKSIINKWLPSKSETREEPNKQKEQKKEKSAVTKLLDVWFPKMRGLSDKEAEEAKELLLASDNVGLVVGLIAGGITMAVGLTTAVLPVVMAGTLIGSALATIDKVVLERGGITKKIQRTIKYLAGGLLIGAITGGIIWNFIKDPIGSTDKVIKIVKSFFNLIIFLFITIPGYIYSRRERNRKIKELKRMRQVAYKNKLREIERVPHFPTRREKVKARRYVNNQSSTVEKVIFTTIYILATIGAFTIASGIGRQVTNTEAEEKEKEPIQELP